MMQSIDDLINRLERDSETETVGNTLPVVAASHEPDLELLEAIDRARCPGRNRKVRVVVLDPTDPRIQVINTSNPWVVPMIRHTDAEGSYYLEPVAVGR